MKALILPPLTPSAVFPAEKLPLINTLPTPSILKLPPTARSPKSEVLFVDNPLGGIGLWF